MYKVIVGVEEFVYEMEYIFFSNNLKEQIYLKDIDYELKIYGFMYKKDKIDVFYICYQEGDIVLFVYMISELDVVKYFYVKLNGLKYDEVVYFLGMYDCNFKNEVLDQLKLLNQKGKLFG